MAYAECVFEHSVAPFEMIKDYLKEVFSSRDFKPENYEIKKAGKNAVAVKVPEKDAWYPFTAIKTHVLGLLRERLTKTKQKESANDR